jgi:hypothetical protein
MRWLFAITSLFLALPAFGQATFIPRKYVVADLPAPSSAIAVLVTDGANPMDCSVGSGTYENWCLWTGTTWEVMRGVALWNSDAPPTCTTTTEGFQYYDASLNEPCFCNGSIWTQVDGGGTCMDTQDWTDSASSAWQDSAASTWQNGG